MVCAKCGKVLAEGSAFCCHCGAQIERPINNNVGVSNGFHKAPLEFESSAAKNEEASSDPSLQAGISANAHSTHHIPASFYAAGSLEQNTGDDGTSTVQQKCGTQDPLNQPETYCPNCGAANGSGAVFCVSCGRSLKTEPIKSGKKRKLLPVIIAASAACIALSLGAFQIFKSRASDIEQEEPATSFVDKETEAPTTGGASQQLKDGQIRIRGDVSAVLAYAERIAQTENVICIYMYDMDGDNISELILKTGTCEADSLYEFYSYSNASLHYLGNLSGGHSILGIQDGKLILHFGIMGYEEIHELTLQQGSVVSTLTFERELIEGQEYLSISEEPFYSEPPSLSVLANTYIISEERIADTTDYFVQADNYFTNGQLSYKLLSDGRILSVDAATGEVLTLFKLDPENVDLFAVTSNRLYFTYDDPDDWWGVEVFSYAVKGEDYQNLGSGWNVEFENGIILLQSFRSDVSPKYVTAIDSQDNTFISEAFAWDAAICDGAVYYLEVSSDNWYGNSPYLIQEYRAQSSGTTLVAEFTMSVGYAAIDGRTIYITQGTEPYTTATYDLLTGKET